MKFLVALAFGAVAVSAQVQSQVAVGQAPACDADYILTRCLSTEGEKPNSCDADDYDCLCYAYQAIATCYNNCPNDPRGPPAKNSAETHCQSASMYGTKAQSKTATPGSSDSTAMPSAPAGAPTTTANLNGAQSTGSPTDQGDFSSSPEKTNAASPLDARGASFVGLAGLFAALL